MLTAYRQKELAKLHCMRDNRVESELSHTLGKISLVFTLCRRVPGGDASPADLTISLDQIATLLKSNDSGRYRKYRESTCYLGEVTVRAGRPEQDADS